VYQSHIMPQGLQDRVIMSLCMIKKLTTKNDNNNGQKKHPRGLRDVILA